MKNEEVEGGGLMNEEVEGGGLKNDEMGEVVGEIMEKKRFEE